MFDLLCVHIRIARSANPNFRFRISANLHASMPSVGHALHGRQNLPGGCAQVYSRNDPIFCTSLKPGYKSEYTRPRQILAAMQSVFTAAANPV